MKISDFIRLIWLSAFLSGISFTLSDCNRAVGNNRQSEIDSIAARYVPDHRIGICDITVTETKERSLILRGETTIPEAKIEIIKTLNNHGTKLIDSILILPDTLANEKYMGLVSISVANLRKNPDHKSELVSQSLMGTPVSILKKENSWLLIQTPDKYIAWTESSSIVPVNQKERISWKKSERVIYIRNSGWIYKEASDKSDVVSDLVAGCIMELSGKSGSYILVKLPDGRGGFVNSKPRVTHVAIYAGNNEYINASGRVMINSLDSTAANFSRNRLKTLLSARRIPGSENDPGITPVAKHLWY